LIRRIRNRCVKILSRIVAASDEQGKEFDATTVVHRRIEVTVERETISILAPTSDGGEAGTAGEKIRALQPQRGELLQSGRTAEDTGPISGRKR